jgi:hypothetical protein
MSLAPAAAEGRLVREVLWHAVMSSLRIAPVCAERDANAGGAVAPERSDRSANRPVRARRCSIANGGNSSSDAGRAAASCHEEPSGVSVRQLWCCSGARAGRA